MAYSAISTASGPPPPDFDAFSYVFQEKLLLVAAESLDSSSTRLCRLADSACVQLRASFATVLSTLSSHASEAKQAMRRLQRSRGVWLGKQLEEVDASEKALESCARLCLCTGLPLVDVDASVCALAPLLSSDTCPRLCALLDLPLPSASVLPSLSTHVQCAPFPPLCALSGPGARLCLPGDAPDALLLNVASVVCVDEAGDALDVMEATDVEISVGAEGGQVVRGPLMTSPGVFEFVYSVPKTTSDVSSSHTSISVSVLGTLVAEARVLVGGAVEGRLVSTITLDDSSMNYGVAVSGDGELLAVSNDGSCLVSLFDTRTGGLIRKFGGRGVDTVQFSTPGKMAFTPPACGTLLVAEDNNRRIQEVTVTGKHVRYIGVGIINGCVRGIATNGALVVVGKYDPGHQIFVFDLETGALVRSFASEGSKPGYLGGCVGVAFTPDGSHILVTERSHCRLSLFTLTGEFVRCMGKEFLKDPYDAVYAANGDILVAERYYNKSCVMVLSSDGQTVLKSFGKAGKEPGEFKYPTALAVFGVRVYVLEWSGNRVQVFE